MKNRDKTFRGNASEFFVAGELCRRGHYAVVTLGNTPNTDVLVSNKNGTKFAHLQVKTFVPGNPTCSVGMKAEKQNSDNFFWVLGGIPEPPSSAFEYYIIPSKIMAEEVSRAHELWLRTPGKNGQPHRDNAVRTVHLPPHRNFAGWNIESYKNRWDLIEKVLC